MNAYEETLNYLYERLPMFTRIGAAALKPNLDNITALCALLNQPQHSFKSIHIAGTNGKGSCSHLLASIFQSAGYKTGLYTSPHLLDFRERIRVNGKMISKDYVCDFVLLHKNDFENIQASFFEYTQALCFDYFRNEKVEIAIIETGLGGRLDSTNIITPELSLITHVAFDHTDLLGDSLSKIAFEKAGIIKPNVPVVIGRKQHECETIYTQKATLNHSPLFYAEDIIEIIDFQNSGNHCTLKYKTNTSNFIQNVTCPLVGNYQKENIQSVLAVCEIVKHNFDLLNDNSIRQGIESVLKNTHFKGRWQCLNEEPLVICDTGHNEEGIEWVMHQIQQLNKEKIHIVFGVVKDKAIQKVLPLLPKNAKYYWCNAQLPRALNANELATNAISFGLIGDVYSSVFEAVNQAMKNASKQDLIFIGGSTFVVAEALTLFDGGEERDER